MNLKQALVTIGLTVGTAFGTALAAAPAFAGILTPGQLGLDALDPVNDPITGGTASPIADFPYVAQEFSFAKDTVVRFNLLNPSGLGSRGAALNNFGFVTNGAFQSIFSETLASDPGGKPKNDFLGTCAPDKAIQGDCVRSILFKAGQLYKLAVQDDKGLTHFGVGALDSFTFNSRSDQLTTNPTQTVAAPGSLFIGMEDSRFRRSGQNHWYDYQDWVVRADVPEPATLAGLGLVASGMLIARRRKVSA